MTRIFLDSDILLDVLTGRLPFSRDAVAVFTLIENKRISGFASSLSFSNLYYVLRKYASHARVIKSLGKLAELIGILNVDESVVKMALSSGFRDFEDALQCFSAQTHPEIELIVTRNIKDFQKCELPVMTPETFLKTIQQFE